MCFGPEATPPPAPRSGQLASSERMVLSSAEGGAPAATLALTTAEDAPGLVLIPDVRGLHPYYEELAKAFAGAGVHTLTFDFYSRTAGSEHRGADFDYAAHRGELTDAGLIADATAAADVLREQGAERIYALGFCNGGRAALLLASEPGWSGSVGFYGWPARTGPEGRGPTADAEAGRVRNPVLALFGAEDAKITPDHREAYRKALESAGVLYEIVAYEGAGHSFFDRNQHEQAETCQDAWNRVLAFIQ
jgi:carboxymethylenebutenolidase